MDLGEFLRLVSIFKFDLRPKREGFRHYIPLMEFIEVFEKNRLYIVTEQELQMEYTKGRIDAEYKAGLKTKPFCAEDPDCHNCEIDVDCGGQELRSSEQKEASG